VSHLRFLPTVPILVAVTPGCSSSELTRAAATRLIDERFGTPDTSQEAVVRLRGPTGNEGLWMNAWTQETRVEGGRPVQVLELTPRGQRLFQQARFFGIDVEVNLLPVFRRRVAEVTGIADAILPFAPGSESSIKEVQFTWQLENVPPWLVVQGPTPRKGNTFLRLYDDGWRVEDLNFTDPEVSIDWSRLPRE
jgi:hypothetical protein